MPKKVTPTIKKIATKKVVAKKSIKKDLSSAKKITAKKSDAKKTLIYADNEHCFWVKNGQVLNSLIALQEALNLMEKDVFSHHVNKDKNDFADWVDSVLCDQICAMDLRKSKTPTSARTVITKHLKFYKI